VEHSKITNVFPKIKILSCDLLSCSLRSSTVVGLEGHQLLRLFAAYENHESITRIEQQYSEPCRYAQSDSLEIF
jgi:hypothetical protein